MISNGHRRCSNYLIKDAQHFLCGRLSLTVETVWRDTVPGLSSIICGTVALHCSNFPCNRVDSACSLLVRSLQYCSLFDMNQNLNFA